MSLHGEFSPLEVGHRSVGFSNPQTCLELNIRPSWRHARKLNYDRIKTLQEALNGNSASAEEARANMAGFFEILHEWAEGDKKDEIDGKSKEKS